MGEVEEIEETIKEKLDVEESLNSGEDSLKSVLKSTVSIEEVEEIFDAELQCSICTELFIKATTVNCSHTFCEFCLFQWRSKGEDTCPICREFIVMELKPLALDNLIEAMLKKLSENFRMSREDAILARTLFLNNVEGNE